jgi:hypothetical protein
MLMGSEFATKLALPSVLLREGREPNKKELKLQLGLGTFYGLY